MFIGIGITPSMQQGGPAIPVPKTISNLLLWTRSDLGITLNAGKVSSWADQSGNGNDLTQGNASQQPTYNSTDAQYNNLPSLSFTSGSGTTLTSPSISYGAFTWFLVARATLNNSYIAARKPAGNPSETIYTGVGASYYLSHSTVSAWNDAAGSGWGVSASPRTYTLRFDGTHAGHSPRVNGADRSLTEVVNNDPGTAALNQAFSVFSDGSSFFGSGTLVEVIIYSRSLTTLEVQTVESYLQTRYAHY